MKQPIYFRKGRTIRGPEGDKVFDSVNQARKESRNLQLVEDGGLGRGSVQVVEKLPEPPKPAA